MGAARTEHSEKAVSTSCICPQVRPRRNRSQGKPRGSPAGRRSGEAGGGRREKLGGLVEGGREPSGGWRGEYVQSSLAASGGSQTDLAQRRLHSPGSPSWVLTGYLSFPLRSQAPVDGGRSARCSSKGPGPPCAPGRWTQGQKSGRGPGRPTGAQPPLSLCPVSAPGQFRDPTQAGGRS